LALIPGVIVGHVPMTVGSIVGAAPLPPLGPLGAAASVSDPPPELPVPLEPLEFVEPLELPAPLELLRPEPPLLEALPRSEPLELPPLDPLWLPPSSPAPFSAPPLELPPPRSPVPEVLPAAHPAMIASPTSPTDVRQFMQSTLAPGKTRERARVPPKRVTRPRSPQNTIPNGHRVTPNRRASRH
jgi:hypothetical protein